VIVFHRHNEIDKDQWDNCIRNSHCTKPYSYSWYLDIISPGWEALVDDDYDSVFPIPVHIRCGIKYIATPIFLQQLGAFSPDKSPDIAMNEFIEFMPSFYRFTDLCVGQNINCKGYTVTERDNYELDLTASYEVLYGNFNRNCKRNIEHSSKHKFKIVEDLTSEDLIRLFLNNKGKEIKGIRQRDYQHLDDLINFCLSNGKGKLLGSRNDSGELVFGLFYIELKGRKTMILLANTPVSHEMRIGYHVYNELIRESACSDTIFDFAGSSIPSVASFMQSFGAKNNPYYRIYRNRLLWPVRMIK
jgi:hypothetical protein